MVRDNNVDRRSVCSEETSAKACSARWAQKVLRKPSDDRPEDRMKHCGGNASSPAKRPSARACFRPRARRNHWRAGRPGAGHRSSKKLRNSAPSRTVGSVRRWPKGYSGVCLNRSALATTLTEDSDIAAAAMIGDSRMPKVG